MRCLLKTLAAAIVTGLMALPAFASTLQLGIGSGGTATTTGQGVIPTITGSGTIGALSPPVQYVICTSTCTVPIPVPVAGYRFCVLNGDNVSTVITLAALGSSAQYENQARTAYGTAGTGTMTSSGAAADRICVFGLDATHYLTNAVTGTWTAH